MVLAVGPLTFTLSQTLLKAEEVCADIERTSVETVALFIISAFYFVHFVLSIVHAIRNHV